MALNSSSDSIYLTSPNGIQIIDSVAFQNQTSNVSLGRQHDGDSIWITFKEPTPNSNNRIREIPDPDYFLIYPNPTSDILYFIQTSSFSIYDMLGKKIISSINVKSIDVRGFSQGIYIFKTDNGQVIKFTKA